MFNLWRDGVNDVGGDIEPDDSSTQTTEETSAAVSKHSIESDLEFDAPLGGKYRSLSEAHKGVAEMESTLGRTLTENRELKALMDSLSDKAQKNPEDLVKHLKATLADEKGPDLKFGLEELGWDGDNATKLEEKLTSNLGKHLSERDKKIIEMVRTEMDQKYGPALEQVRNAEVLEIVPIAADERFKQEMSKVTEMVASGKLTPQQQIALITAGMHNKLVADIGKEQAEKKTRQRAKDGNLPSAAHAKPSSDPDSKDEKIQAANAVMDKIYNRR